MVLVVKNRLANTGDIRDAGLIPRSGSSLGGGDGSLLHHSCLENPSLAWRVPRTEEPGGLQSLELQSDAKATQHAVPLTLSSSSQTI